MNRLFISSPSVVLACVCMNTHMHCIYAKECMTVYEEVTYFSIWTTLVYLIFSGFVIIMQLILLLDTSYSALRTR